VTIRLPGLRERPGDVQLLTANFLRRFRAESGREIIGFTDAAMAALQRYHWPGNVRELENAIERAVVVCRRPHIDVQDLPETVLELPTRAAGNPDDAFTANPMPLELALEGPERRIIQAALDRNNWNRQLTAAELNINRTTLYKKMRKHRLDSGVAN
jgi:DNA-binding NtrC family response regulator